LSAAALSSRLFFLNCNGKKKKEGRKEGKEKGRKEKKASITTDQSSPL